LYSIRRVEGNAGVDVPPSRVARSVSPDDLESSYGDHGVPEQLGSADVAMLPVNAASPKARHAFDEGIASKFKIRTCSGPFCLSPSGERVEGALNAFEAFVALARNRAPTVEIEESSICLLGSSNGNDGCLANGGGCCVEVRHEQSSKVRRYVNLKTQSDVEKVWSCVEAAIRAMEVKQGAASV
jgi:hypothetical protein